MLLVGVNCISLIGITTVFDRGSTLFKLHIAMRSAIVSFDVFGCRGDHDCQWAVFNMKTNRVRVGVVGFPMIISPILMRDTVNKPTSSRPAVVI